MRTEQWATQPTTKTVIKVAVISLAAYAAVTYLQSHVMVVPVVGGYLPTSMRPRRIAADNRWAQMEVARAIATQNVQVWVATFAVRLRVAVIP